MLYSAVNSEYSTNVTKIYLLISKSSSIYENHKHNNSMSAMSSNNDKHVCTEKLKSATTTNKQQQQRPKQHLAFYLPYLSQCKRKWIWSMLNDYVQNNCKQVTMTIMDLICEHGI